MHSPSCSVGFSQRVADPVPWGRVPLWLEGMAEVAAHSGQPENRDGEGPGTKHPSKDTLQRPASFSQVRLGICQWSQNLYVLADCIHLTVTKPLTQSPWLLSSKLCVYFTRYKARESWELATPAVTNTASRAEAQSSKHSSSSPPLSEHHDPQSGYLQEELVRSPSGAAQSVAVGPWCALVSDGCFLNWNSWGFSHKQK